jgi:hypothetical protein
VRLPETFHNVTRARLMTAELPTSFFVFSAQRGNTTIRVGLDGDFRDVTIADGSYGFKTIASELAASLALAFPGRTFTVAISPVTLRCTITSSNGGDTIAIDTTALATTARTQWGLAYYLGFERDVVAQGTTASGVVVSPRVCNVNPELYVLLDIREMSTVRETGIYGEGGMMGKVFAKIPLNVESFQYVFFDRQITHNELAPPIARLESLRISFRFHDGTPINFRGIDHSMTIEIECTPTRAV